jgi:predicted nucleotidyltransferase
MPPAPLSVTQLLQPAQAELARLGVRELLLFGSRARGDARPDSDWDFVVEFSAAPDFDRFMGVRQLLEDCLGGRVDLLSRSACPPRLWRAIEPELLHAA